MDDNCSRLNSDPWKHQLLVPVNCDCDFIWEIQLRILRWLWIIQMGLTWMRRRPCETEAVMWSQAKQCWQHQELKGLRHRFYPRAPGGSTALSAL